MSSKRGRPRLYDEKLIVSTILQYKDSLVNVNNKIISKNSKIWTDISRQLNNIISENALYTLTVKNRFGLKDQILNTDIKQMSKLHVSSDLSCSNMSDSVSLNESDNNLNHSIKISFEKVEI